MDLGSPGGLSKSATKADPQAKRLKCGGTPSVHVWGIQVEFGASGLFFPLQAIWEVILVTVRHNYEFEALADGFLSETDDSGYGII